MLRPGLNCCGLCVPPLPPGPTAAAEGGLPTAPPPPDPSVGKTPKTYLCAVPLPGLAAGNLRTMTEVFLGTTNTSSLYSTAK